MRFVGKLSGVPEGDRPVQCLSHSLLEVRQWAVGIVKHTPGAKVEILERVEQVREVHTYESANADQAAKQVGDRKPGEGKSA